MKTTTRLGTEGEAVLLGVSSPPSRRLAGTGTHAALFVGLCAVLLFGPLAFGATERWSTFTLQVIASLLFLGWAATQIAAGTLEIPKNPLLAPMGGFALLVVAQVAFGITVYLQNTVYESLLYVGYGFLFLVALHSLRDEKPLRRFAMLLVFFGFLIALFGIIHGFTSNDKLYWLRTPRQLGPMYGPYLNHNHFAGLMEMLLPFPLMLALTPRYAAKRFLLGFAAVMMTVSVFLSQSRGGMIAVAVQMTIVGYLLVRQRSASRGNLLFALCCAAVLGLGLWLGSSALVDRLKTLTTPLEDGVAGMRLKITSDSLEMIAQRPVLGWGLGTFPEVYPRFRTWYDGRFVNRAHNDYLELVADTGLVGLAVVGWFLVALYRRGLEQSQRWRAESASTIRAAALLGVTGILVHSLSDFNLHIPANAALFYVLCAVATASPSSRGVSKRSAKQEENA